MIRIIEKHTRSSKARIQGCRQHRWTILQIARDSVKAHFRKRSPFKVVLQRECPCQCSATRCHLCWRVNGSVVAPFRPETSNPVSSSWAVPTSRGNHDEADERTERARRALVRARWEAQGWCGPTRRESSSTRQVAPIRSQTTEPSILLLLEGRTLAVPSRRGTPRRL